MNLFSSAAFSVLALGTMPALALDLGNGLSLTGNVELEYVSYSDGDDATVGFSDLTFGWRSQGGGALGFGVDLTLVNFEDFDDNEGRGAVWGGLVLTTGLGEFTIGNPRPLIETMITSPDIGGFRLLDLELATVTGSTLEGLMLFQEDVDSYGVSFKGTSGALTYGASYHKLEQGPFEADAIELVMTYQMGKTALLGGAEIIDTPSTDGEKLLLGATYTEDRWSAGALLTSASQGSSDYDSVKLWGDYSISDAFSVGAQVMSLNGNSSGQTFYGITGEYGFGAGGFAELGVFDSDDAGGDRAYQASIGYRF